MWAIDPLALADAAQAIREPDEGAEFTYLWTNPILHKWILDTQPTGVFAVGPSQMHERLIYQQGEALVAGNPYLSFVSNLLAMPGFRPTLSTCRIVIPHSCRHEAMLDLSRMNINRATLFPGIDGVAQSLNVSVQLWSDDPEGDYFHYFDMSVSEAVTALRDDIGTIFDPDSEPE